MRITAWRITRPAHASTAFDGEGARRYGGRWNSIGTPVVYVAESQSLAVLEMIVHLGADVADQYGVIPVEFEEKYIDVLPANALPRDWMAEPAPQSTQSVGDNWVAGMHNVLLKVPSKIVRNEYNYVINPNHPAFSKIVIGKPETFVMDSRLLKKV